MESYFCDNPGAHCDPQLSKWINILENTLDISKNPWEMITLFAERRKVAAIS